MIQNFIFSVEVVFPLFLVMAVGYILRQKGFISQIFASELSKLLYHLIMPVAIFSDIWKADLSEGLPIAFLLLVAGGILMTSSLAWTVGGIMGLKPSKRGAFAHGAFRGNYVYVGLSILRSLGVEVGVMASATFVVNMFFYVPIAVIMLSPSGEKRLDGRTFFRSIVTNPLLIGVFVGLGAKLIGLPQWPILDRTVGYFTQMSTPIALLAIGANFNIRASAQDRGISLVAAGLKLFVNPLIILILGLILRFDPVALITLYVSFGTPTAINSYAMTREMGGDGDLAANIILYTTLASAISMTLFVFTFRTLGWIV